MDIETKKFIEKYLRICRVITYRVKIIEYPAFYEDEQGDSDEIGDRFYKCELCGKEFKVLGKAITHLRRKEMRI